MKHRLCIIILLIFITPKISESQNFRKVDQLGLNIGTSYYLGDYNKIPFNQLTPSLGVFYRYSIDKRFSTRATLNYLKAKGNKNSIPKAFQTPPSFEQDIYDLNVVGEFNFIPYIACNKKYFFTPYLFAGLGFNYLHDSKNFFQCVIPFGVGIKYNISESFTIDIESSFYKTFNDYVDCEYKIPTKQNIFHIGKQKFYHGNKDWYSIFGIKLAYSIKFAEKCIFYD